MKRQFKATKFRPFFSRRVALESDLRVKAGDLLELRASKKRVLKVPKRRRRLLCI